MTEYVSGPPYCPVKEPHCHVVDEVMLLRHQVQQLQSEAQTDALTGLYNYRYFVHLLEREMERVRRSQLPLALILADIDHFKRFNDQHGHEAGNRALGDVAAIIREQIRQLDSACRFGGEEFVVLLPATPVSQALAVAERIRAAVESQTAHLPRPLTLSLGVAVYTPQIELSAQDLLIAADERLYASKHRGRNAVTGPQVVDTQVSAEEKGALFDSSITDDA